MDEGLYNLKMGAGWGITSPHSRQNTSLLTINSAEGSWRVIELEANTAFGEHLFAYLGADLRWELIAR